MPWQTPTLRQVRETIRDDITGALSGASVVGNRVLRIMADAQAGLARLLLIYLDWIAKQLMPDTAETEWLDRHGDIWLQNSDGSIGRKAATFARGTVTLTGTEGVSVPEGTELSGVGIGYETMEDILIGAGETPVAIQALDAGAAGNLNAGETISLTAPMTGVNGEATVVELVGGADIETDDELRVRVLQRIQKPPMGGDADDFVAWTLAIPSVTRAWCAPREMGMGTVTVRFMCDALRADADGFPTESDIETVKAYLDIMRPVAVRDFYVLAPLPEAIDFSVNLLDNDSLAVRAEVEASVEAMIKERARPATSVNGELIDAQTIYSAWVAEAIAKVVDEFTLVMDDHAMPHGGALAVMGTVTYLPNG